MTWLGKILALCAMVLALVWMWFTATVYVTRTNWKAQADGYKEAYAKARDARESEYRVYLTEKDALARQAKEAEKRAEGLASQVATLEKTNKDYTGQIASLNGTLKDFDVQAVQLQANYQAQIEESNKTRTRANDLEQVVVRLTVAKEEAEAGKLAADIGRKQAQIARQKAEDRTRELEDRLAQGQGSGRPGTVPLEPAPAKPPEGFRGSVDLYEPESGNMVLSVGFEAGLGVGSVVDVYRIGKGLADTKYLGTAKVTSVLPKSAVAAFRPASGRPVRQLRPDEQPRKDDTVGPNR
ncbi:MAG: hypothetical protein K2X82_12395 [Gemmataceae bacterium]|nr:hypothetical protein [Gemmataceae bacterium]